MVDDPRTVRCAAPLKHALFDIGANLAHPKFRGKIPALLKRAKESGLSHIMITGTSVKDSIGAIQTCHSVIASATVGNPTSPVLYCTVGVHPHSAGDHLLARPPLYITPAAVLIATMVRNRNILIAQSDMLTPTQSLHTHCQ